MIIALLRLMRLYYSLPLAGGFIVIVFYLVGGNVTHIYKQLVLSFLSLSGIISAAYVYNDVCDVDIDEINCPNRMLPCGKINRKTALLWSIVLFIAGFVFAALCNWKFFSFMCIIGIALIFYDIFSKRIGIFKDILVASLMTSLYPLAFTLTDSIQTVRLKVLFIHPLWLFLTSLGYEMLKDIRDFKGDRKINSPAIADYSPKKSFLYISQIIIVTASLITPLPFVLGYCKKIYLLASIGAIILAILSTRKKPTIAIRYIYAEVFLITAGSVVDLLVFGP